MMASQTLKHRPPKDEISAASTATSAAPAPASAGPGISSKSPGNRKLQLAKRGLRSLAVAVSIPASATVASIVLAGASLSSAKPAWTPPVWAFHAGSLVMSSLLGLSAWLVWAEGGFHRRSEALPLYLAELLMALLWAPLLFRSGSAWPAMGVCFAHFAVLLMLLRSFRHVSPIAADLIKPYLAWVSILAVFNYKFL